MSLENCNNCGKTGHISSPGLC
ncbi:hypothetical protein PLA107_030305 (plasmid) [Pseudomonas amygdali pv. lachrymans str. M301315]|uniref:CCHC-type domain-containing protein n=1 Tax=Pseudomonas amygdali pv. lachrymans str. M301315 TaxID=629260 RepID=A0AAD0VAM7_PSEAV|nr:hypothetical protein PLA107_030305 [Pseudomonas amygdali pv. lachrymans str. M301315]